MNLSTHSRRSFLQRGAATAAAGLAAPALISPLANRAFAAPSEQVVVGSIGLGGQGNGIMRRASRFGPVAAVCDVDANRRQRGPKDAARYEDYRKVLDHKDIDVITIGTPDHWHTKIAIDAMRAGKDVYCEKPLTLTIDECRQILKVLEETGRVLQVGTQQRSGANTFLKAIAMVRDGRVGKVKKLTVCVNRNPYSDAIAEAPVPKELNWELWQGQTPLVPYRKESGVKHFPQVKGGGDGGGTASNCHYEFRWWLQYSGGKMTDWGAHHVDSAQWMIEQVGPDQGPLSIEPVKVEQAVDFDEQGNPVQTDRYNVPKMFEVKAVFPDDIEMIITSDGRNGILVEGTEARLFVNRGGVNGTPVEELSSNPLPEDAIEKVYGGPLNSHMGNFMDCVKTRKRPVADARSHCPALATCHLSNIALRLNRKIQWDAKAKQVVGDPVANSMLAREQRKGYEIDV